jgi:hypothetical protein
MTKPAAKRAAPKPAAAKKRAAAAPAPSMLESGIQALARARKQAESGPAKVMASLIDPFGFRKLEDVFDHRVASALERLGWPNAQALADLLQEVETLRQRVAKLEKPGR